MLQMSRRQLMVCEIWNKIGVTEILSDTTIILNLNAIMK